MWVKICANTNLEDALIAVQFGADALGFVFAPSKRKVTSTQVAEIVGRLPAHVEKVGVFTTHDAAEITAIVHKASLTGVQLHGGFDLVLANTLRRELGPTVSITQTLHWKVGDNTESAREVREQIVTATSEPAIARILLDSKTLAGVGGTGHRFDWSQAREALSGFTGKLIVAGGLEPGNVSDAIAALEPWGVDVASGVESEPGRKDALKLRSFIQNSR